MAVVPSVYSSGAIGPEIYDVLDIASNEAHMLVRRRECPALPSPPRQLR